MRRYHEQCWTGLSKLLSLRLPSLRALRLEVHSLDYSGCWEALDTLCEWLCKLPSSVEYIQLEHGGYVEDKIHTWMTNHRRVFLDWLPNLRGVSWWGYMNSFDSTHLTSFKSVGIHDQCELLSVDLLPTSELEPGSTWLKTLSKLQRLQHLQLGLSDPWPRDLANLCDLLPASLKTLFLSWDAAEAFSFDEWSCFGQLKGLQQLCILLDVGDCVFEPHPADVTYHLSQLLPEAIVLVSAWGDGDDETHPPALMDRVFMPNQQRQAWMEHKFCLKSKRPYRCYG